MPIHWSTEVLLPGFRRLAEIAASRAAVHDLVLLDEVGSVGSLLQPILNKVSFKFGIGQSACYEKWCSIWARSLPSHASCHSGALCETCAQCTPPPPTSASTGLLKHRVGIGLLFSGFFGTAAFCGPECRIGCFVTHL